MREKTPGPKPRCAFCGDELSGRGPASPVDGKRFCSSKRSCIAARARLRREQRLGPPEMEERPCSACGITLPARPARSTDSPLGRWCPTSRKCQAARARHLYNVGVAERRFAEAAIVECPTCGLPDAREGFPHVTPAADPAPCTNQGWWVEPIYDHIARNAWPDLLAAAMSNR